MSAFTSAKIDRILELQPDLVLGFSDLQADIAADLVRGGVEVHVFNHRSVAGILGMILTLGGMIGCGDKARALVASLESGLDGIRTAAAALPRRPRVYFEEWDEPQISGIRWVAELVELAGGIDCFPELARESLGRNRIIADPLEVPRRAPDIILGSWCGKKFRPGNVAARPGWQDVPAVRDGQLFEVKSSIILQPGPAGLTDGVRDIQRRSRPGLAPVGRLAAIAASRSSAALRTGLIASGSTRNTRWPACHAANSRQSARRIDSQRPLVSRYAVSRLQRLRVLRGRSADHLGRQRGPAPSCSSPASPGSRARTACRSAAGWCPPRTCPAGQKRDESGVSTSSIT